MLSSRTLGHLSHIRRRSGASRSFSSKLDLAVRIARTAASQIEGEALETERLFKRLHQFGPRGGESERDCGLLISAFFQGSCIRLSGPIASENVISEPIDGRHCGARDGMVWLAARLRRFRCRSPFGFCLAPG